MRHSKFKITKEKYQGDASYERVYEIMQLLGIEDVTTHVQYNNGTIVWRLPIKNVWPKDKSGKSYKCIEVASFSTGYVRNQNSGYSNYQLNKRCDSEPEYYNINPPHQEPLYRKFTTKSCVLIPIEIDRLEYLISYCLKNYFVKRANEVANGEHISKAHHEWELEKLGYYKNEYKNRSSEVNELQEKLDAMTEDRDNKDTRIINLELQYEVLQNKLEEEVKRYDNAVQPLESELAEARVRQDVSVIVNGHRYKVL